MEFRASGEHLRSSLAIPGTLLLFTITQVRYLQEESVNGAFGKNDSLLYMYIQASMKYNRDITRDCQATAAVNSKTINNFC